MLIAFSIKTEYTKENNNFKRNSNIEVGRFYIHRIDNDKDPFDKIWVDTILILNKKDGYIKWISKKWMEDSSKYWNSSEEEYLEKNINPL